MPTPVNTARQCLTDDAARALDEAVAVARRRSHGQTTSLHAVSALLALPSSMLREACGRARSSAYSPRLQFRALELSVGVSLDRLPSSKTVDDPPVSNSLMAAIKRSQANQRRQPETFHLYQQMQQLNQSSIPNVKVELKHFIISILDDPIVSRVFGEAGFRSYDIKLAIVHPPPVSLFSRTRVPPMFLCNSSDSESIGRSFNFPFAGFSNLETGDENCRRIGEILVKKTGKNPLLIGACSSDALNSFTESVQRNQNGVLPAEIGGLSVICIEKEICEFVTKGGSEELMGSKFKELGDMLESCSGPGVVVNYGGLEAFVDDGAVGSVSYVVSQLTGLLEVHGGKLWLIGAAGCHETYKKFLAKFHSIEKDWDLNLLPITSSKASIVGLYSKPSLIGSFVPLGGFFSSPSEIQCQLGSSNQSITRCNLCNGKYEHELSVILKGGSTISVADKYSANLSSWLQKPDCDTSKGLDEAKDDRTVLSAKLVELQRKWNDICQRLHRSNWKETAKESCTSGSGSETVSSFLPVDLQLISRPKQNIYSKAENLNFQTNARAEVSKSQQLEMGIPRSPSYPVGGLSLSHNRTSSSCATSVTTDLGLGTLYESAGDEPRKPKLQGQKDRIQYFSGSVSAELDGLSEHTSNRIAQSSSSCTELGGKLDPNDFKSLWRVLSDKVSWQEEAVSTVCQTISRCRSGNGRRRGSNQRGDIWLSILGQSIRERKRECVCFQIHSGDNNEKFGNSSIKNPLHCLAMAVTFYNLSSDSGLKKLDEYLLTRSYISGYQASKDDITVHAALSKPPSSEYVNVSRWYNHIDALLRLSGVSGDGCGVTVEGSAPISEEAVATPPQVDSKASAAEDDDDDDDVDLFGEETEEEKKAAEERAAAVKASGKKKESGKSSVLLDVKPWDDETDMQKLEEAVRSVQMEGLLWGASKLVPVGYGIKKLQVMMTIVDDLVSVDTLIEECLTAEPINEYVQSCDIVAFNKI